MNLSEYEGVVYDLDGTLVRLAVDWEQSREDAAAVYREAGLDPVGESLWDLLEAAEEHGIRTDVEAVLSDHERRGARDSERLPAAADLLALQRPAGVCSLNCEDACRIALDRHGLTDAVAAVVGRDTVENWKPHPEPLLTTIERIGLSPETVVFVGDSVRDENTARRAGVDFQYVDGEPSGY